MVDLWKVHSVCHGVIDWGWSGRGETRGRNPRQEEDCGCRRAWLRMVWGWREGVHRRHTWGPE